MSDKTKSQKARSIRTKTQIFEILATNPTPLMTCHDIVDALRVRHGEVMSLQSVAWHVGQLRRLKLIGRRTIHHGAPKYRVWEGPYAGSLIPKKHVYYFDVVRKPEVFVTRLRSNARNLLSVH